MQCFLSVEANQNMQCFLSAEANQNMQCFLSVEANQNMLDVKVSMPTSGTHLQHLWGVAQTAVRTASTSGEVTCCTTYLGVGDVNLHLSCHLLHGNELATQVVHPCKHRVRTVTHACQGSKLEHSLHLPD